MRLKASEIVSSFEFYTRTGEFKDEDTLTIMTDCDGEGMTYVEDESMVQVLEMLGCEGVGLVNLSHTNHTETKYEREYVMTFEEYFRENNYDTSNVKNCLGKLSDCTVREDDLDDFADDEEE